MGTKSTTSRPKAINLKLYNFNGGPFHRVVKKMSPLFNKIG
jgi:hypothetical protein